VAVAVPPGALGWAHGQERPRAAHVGGGRAADVDEETGQPRALDDKYLRDMLMNFLVHTHTLMHTYTSDHMRTQAHTHRHTASPVAMMEAPG
jgi:hypothetical protein